ncbi:MAG: DUF6134 family protein [Kiloniellales bacterium]
MSCRNQIRSALVVVVALAAWLDPGASQAAQREFTYKLMLGSKKMGTQVIRVAAVDLTNNGFDVRTRMNIDFSPFIFINVKVQQVTREVWRDGRIVGFESKTNDRGDKFHVQAKPDGDRLVVTGSEDTWSASHAAAPTSYWYEPLFKGRNQFFDTKTGKVRDSKLEFVDMAEVTYRGRRYPVRHYRLADDKKSREFWYFETGVLYMTRYKEQGSSVIYVLQ